MRYTQYTSSLLYFTVQTAHTMDEEAEDRNQTEWLTDELVTPKTTQTGLYRDDRI